MSQLLEVRSPHDGSLIARLPEWTAEDVARALDHADRLFRNRERRLKEAERIEILAAAARLMKDRKEALALQAAREGGKPLMDSRAEVLRAIDGLDLCVETLRTQCGTQVPMNNAASQGRLAFTWLEPIGPVSAISAFNHPLNLIVHQAGPAIAAGCPVIVKPAAETPLSCLALAEIFREAGLPEGWFQVAITSDVGVAEKLVTDPRIAFFSFIGSAGVGWMLRSKLAPGTRCALEHGGVAPVIVAEDADLDEIVPLLVKGGYYHAGQVCVSVQRVFAARAIADEVAERLAAGAARLKVGDPTNAETEVGPLIRSRDLDRVHSWVEEARAAGAAILAGGERQGTTCYRPTLVYGAPDSVRLAREEVFGPVISVSAFDDLDEALARSNSLPFAFQAAVCTRNLDTAMYLARRIDASAVMINDHTAFRVDWMPFAGLRRSGLGVGGISHTMREMQVEKMVVIRSRGL